MELYQALEKKKISPVSTIGREKWGPSDGQIPWTPVPHGVSHPLIGPHGKSRRVASRDGGKAVFLALGECDDFCSSVLGTHTEVNRPDLVRFALEWGVTSRMEAACDGSTQGGQFPLSVEPSWLCGMLVELAFHSTLAAQGSSLCLFHCLFFPLCFLNPWVFNLTDFHPVGWPYGKSDQKLRQP